MEFINSFVRKGQLTLLSMETRIDQDDCVGVTPTGKLILSLTKGTFQQLGIEGRVVDFSRKHPDRFGMLFYLVIYFFLHLFWLNNSLCYVVSVVTIDLMAESFQEGRKNYDHVKQRLQSLENLVFNVILAWDPHGNI